MGRLDGARLMPNVRVATVGRTRELRQQKEFAIDPSVLTLAPLLHAGELEQLIRSTCNLCFPIQRDPISPCGAGSHWADARELSAPHFEFTARNGDHLKSPPTHESFSR